MLTFLSYSASVEKISKLFFQMGAQVYSVPGQTEGTRKAFWNGKAQTYPLNYILQKGVMLAIIIECSSS